jgi:hypothetical protein
MADEVTQAVMFEIQSARFLITGSARFVAESIRAIQAIVRFAHGRYINAPGKSSWSKIQQASEGNAMVVEIPKEMFDEMIDNPFPTGDAKISRFNEFVRSKKLRYCELPDLNTKDGYIPVGVVSQDIAVWQSVMKQYMELRIKKQKEKDEEYDKRIAKAKEKLLAAHTPEEKEAAQKELDALIQAKKENKDLLEESEEKAARNNTLTFEEYLKQGKGTHFEKDPELGVKEANTCGVIHEFKPSECMIPIRDADLIPDGEEIFYSQRDEKNRLLTVRRHFEKDENGLAFSTYQVTSPDGATVHEFCDRGYTTDAWKEQIAAILKDAGMQADAPTVTMTSRERFEEYRRGVNANFSEARKAEEEAEGQKKESAKKNAEKTAANQAEASRPQPSSRESADYIREQEKAEQQRRAYEESQKEVLTVSSEQILPDENENLSMEVDGKLVEGIKVEDMDSEEARVRIDPEKSYTVKDARGETSEQSGQSILDTLRGEKAEKSEAQTAARIHGKSRK